MIKLRNSKYIEVYNFIIDELAEYNGSVYLYDSKYAYFRNKKESSAYFISPEKINTIKYPQIHIGCKQSEELFITSLIHEYCHFKQWVGPNRLWKKYGTSFKHTAIIEKQCEEMTIKFIKKWKLPVDIQNYIKHANAYIIYCQLSTIIQFKGLKAYNDFIVNVMPSDEIVDPMLIQCSKRLILEYLQL